MRALRCLTGWPPNSPASVDPPPRRTFASSQMQIAPSTPLSSRPLGTAFCTTTYTARYAIAQMRMIGESAVRDLWRLETIVAEHALIAEAVCDGDLNRSQDAIKAHLAGTERTLGFTAD